jgi:hypothetical protein
MRHDSACEEHTCNIADLHVVVGKRDRGTFHIVQCLEAVSLVRINYTVKNGSVRVADGRLGGRNVLVWGVFLCVDMFGSLQNNALVRMH